MRGGRQCERNRVTEGVRGKQNEREKGERGRREREIERVTL